ncbi:hypothetical protein Godav_021242 [Gossypium davidsonii]|uniref:Uncharacterized protein n=1 Tax=Gossypium davidsonii TaxID=34287 RepID=A0A7J8R711_GOSDV|nr:hypothetical protein [Gossypium davidsonii]
MMLLMCQIIGANGIKIIKYLYFLMRSGAVLLFFTNFVQTILSNLKTFV